MHYDLLSGSYYDKAPMSFYHGSITITRTKVKFLKEFTENLEEMFPQDYIHSTILAGSNYTIMCYLS